jgi:hypothetical protein
VPTRSNVVGADPALVDQRLHQRVVLAVPTADASILSRSGANGPESSSAIDTRAGALATSPAALPPNPAGHREQVRARVRRVLVSFAEEADVRTQPKPVMKVSPALNQMKLDFHLARAT